MSQRLKTNGIIAIAFVVILCLAAAVSQRGDGVDAPVSGGVAVGGLSADIATRTPTPAPTVPTTIASPTDTLAPTPTMGPTNTPRLSTPTPSRKDRYIAIAKDAAMTDIRGGDVPAGRWDASVINVGDGPELEITMPLNPALSNDQFVRQARRNLAGVINALFVADPELFRITAIGTFPDLGPETPAVSIFVYRSKSDHWGTVTADELDTLAEWVNIKPRFR